MLDFHFKKNELSFQLPLRVASKTLSIQDVLEKP